MRSSLSANHLDTGRRRGGGANRLPVKNPILRGPLDPSRSRLINVDMLHPVIVRVVLHDERDGRIINGIAQGPADALLRENIGDVVRESFVLKRVAPLLEVGRG